MRLLVYHWLQGRRSEINIRCICFSALSRHAVLLQCRDGPWSLFGSALNLEEFLKLVDPALFNLKDTMKCLRFVFSVEFEVLDYEFEISLLAHERDRNVEPQLFGRSNNASFLMQMRGEKRRLLFS